MSGNSGKPLWLRLLFIVIGLLLIVKMVAQDLLPHFGEKCKGVTIEVEQKQYYEKNNQNKNSRAIKKTKWHYSWTFYVDDKKYSGHVDLGEKSKKIGNIATVYYFAPLPWINCIDIGSSFGISSISGMLLGIFFLYLGLSRSKKKEPMPVLMPTGIESKPVVLRNQKIETKAQADVVPSKQLANSTNIQTASSEPQNDNVKINFCPNCGSKVFEGAGFCANCGKKLA